MAYSVFYGVVYSFVGILGLVIGSFLNVCIYRIPKGESIVLPRSHCTACENVLPWYDLIPVISFIHLRGECRNCKEHISIQYPMIELINGIGYVWIFLLRGWKLGTILDCILFSIFLFF